MLCSLNCAPLAILTIDLVQLGNLAKQNLRYQMMTTIVWMEQEWNDPKLKWDPDDYGGINKVSLLGRVGARVG